MILLCYKPRLAVAIQKHSQIYAVAVSNERFWDMGYNDHTDEPAVKFPLSSFTYWSTFLKTTFSSWFSVELFNDGHSNEIGRSESENSIYISTCRWCMDNSANLRITWGLQTACDISTSIPGSHIPLDLATAYISSDEYALASVEAPGNHLFYHCFT